MNMELRTKAQDYLEKDFLTLINNYVLGKTMENLRKYRDIKLVINGRRKSYLMLEQKYQIRKCFSKKLLAK